MVKTVIIPQESTYSLPIPTHYIGKSVEVFLYSVDEIVENKEPVIPIKRASAKKFVSRWAGFLKDANIDPDKAKYDYLTEKYR